jgi:hypothetical protein
MLEHVSVYASLPKRASQEQQRCRHTSSSLIGIMLIDQASLGVEHRSYDCKTGLEGLHVCFDETTRSIVSNIGVSTGPTKTAFRFTYVVCSQLTAVPEDPCMTGTECTAINGSDCDFQRLTFLGIG